MGKVFVNNLAGDVNESDLQELFERYGEVWDVKIWRNSRTGRSEGWGFVEMENELEAERASHELDGIWWHERRLEVQEAATDR